MDVDRCTTECPHDYSSSARDASLVASTSLLTVTQHPLGSALPRAAAGPWGRGTLAIAWAIGATGFTARPPAAILAPQASMLARLQQASPQLGRFLQCWFDSIGLLAALLARQALVLYPGCDFGAAGFSVDRRKHFWRRRLQCCTAGCDFGAAGFSVGPPTEIWRRRL